MRGEFEFESGKAFSEPGVEKGGGWHRCGSVRGRQVEQVRPDVGLGGGGVGLVLGMERNNSKRIIIVNNKLKCILLLLTHSEMLSKC